MTFECRLDPESSFFLDSRFRGNDGIRAIVNLLLRHYTIVSKDIRSRSPYLPYLAGSDKEILIKFWKLPVKMWS